MAGIAVTRMELTAVELRRVAGRSKAGRAARRMLAIALVLEGVDRATAAQTCGMDRQTLRGEADQETVRGTVFPANARVGQHGTLTRIRARCGTRPRAPRDTRCQWAFARSLEPVAFAGSLFGAVCPARRHRGRAGPALRQHGGDEPPPGRNHPHGCPVGRKRRPCPIELAYF